MYNDDNWSINSLSIMIIDDTKWWQIESSLLLWLIINQIMDSLFTVNDSQFLSYQLSLCLLVKFYWVFLVNAIYCVGTSLFVIYCYFSLLSLSTNKDLIVLSRKHCQRVESFHQSNCFIVMSQFYQNSALKSWPSSNQASKPQSSTSKYVPNFSFKIKTELNLYNFVQTLLQNLAWTSTSRSLPNLVLKVWSSDSEQK